MTPVEAQKSSQKDYAASFQDIQCAAERIAPHIHITPVCRASWVFRVCDEKRMGARSKLGRCRV
eukprot:scaffold258775_cov21-Tisochrysis_lutea.AAC.1